MISSHAWTEQDAARLYEENKYKILDSLNNFWQHIEAKSYQAAEYSIEQAINFAAMYNEPNWQVYARHWRLQIWLHYIGVVNKALPEALDLVNFVSDPSFKSLPQRICAYDDLVHCYIYKDWKGYEEKIHETIDGLLATVNPHFECFGCMNHYKASMYAKSGDLYNCRYHLQAILDNRHDGKAKFAFYSVLGECLNKMQKPDHALDLFSRASKWKSERDHTYVEEAQSNILKKEYLQAKICADKALKESQTNQQNLLRFAAYDKLAMIEYFQNPKSKRLLEYLLKAYQSISGKGFIRDEILILLKIIKTKNEWKLNYDKELKLALTLEQSIPSTDLIQRLRKYIRG